MSGALIVTAELGPEDAAWFDRLRQRYFPPERNVLKSHLTMFHALPPSAEEEVKRVLSDTVRRPAPNAEVSAPYSLGRGVAFRIMSRELEEARAAIASHFQGCLTAQDGQGWRPHITVQNKVDPAVARATLHALAEDFRPRSVIIRGVGLHRYLDGPWARIADFPFRG